MRPHSPRHGMECPFRRVKPLPLQGAKIGRPGGQRGPRTERVEDLGMLSGGRTVGRDFVDSPFCKSRDDVFVKMERIGAERAIRREGALPYNLKKYPWPISIGCVARMKRAERGEFVGLTG